MTEYQVQVNRGGTISLPGEIQRQYQLDPGDTFTFLDLGGVFVLSPRPSAVHRLATQIEGEREEAGISLEELIEAARRDREQQSSRE